MKQRIFQGILIAALFLPGSCTQNGSGEGGENTVTEKLSDEEARKAEIEAIEKLLAESGQTASSLRYTREDGASVVVHAHLSQENVLLKIEEEFSEPNGGSAGKIDYYLKDKVPFATREYFDDRSNASAPKFVERISYYDKKGKVEKTIEKRVDFEEELDRTEFQPAPLHACPMDRAMQVLDQKGSYETTFQGFVEAEVLNYLVVGENKPGGYTSALRCDYEDALLQELMRNQKKYLGKKLRVSFETVQDPSGFEFQIYTGGQLAE